MPARTKSRRHAGKQLPGAKRNRGHDPLYKEVDRGSADIVRSSKTKIVPAVDHTTRTKRVPEPELSESVRRYLAERQIASFPEADPSFVEHQYERGDGQQNLRTGLNDSIVSHRDIVIEMYLDRKLRAVELTAARMWQHYMEESCIQPPTSFDPGGNARYDYQLAGTISESQHRAMVIRSIAEKAVGRASRIFLDAVLQPDIGRQRIGHKSLFLVESRLTPILKGLAILFHYANGNPEFDQSYIDAAAELYDWDLRFHQTLAEEKHGVAGWQRAFNYENTTVIRGLA